jgi:hypothetical protein
MEENEINFFSVLEIAALIGGAYFAYCADYSLATLFFVLAIYLKIKSYEE